MGTHVAEKIALCDFGKFDKYNQVRKVPYKVGTRELDQRRSLLVFVNRRAACRRCLQAMKHLEENKKIFGFELTAADMARISAIQKRARKLSDSIGDCGDEYRRGNGSV